MGLAPRSFHLKLLPSSKHWKSEPLLVSWDQILERPSMASAAKKTTRQFRADVSQVLKLVINSLYSHREIFLRELISNASDALDKLNFEALSRPELRAGDDPLEIRLMADEEAGTLTITDTGIGMDRDELIENLGTIAHSGTQNFLAGMEEGADPLQLIGQFGVGFYSGFLVADKMEVISTAAGSDETWRWVSTAEDKFTVAPATEPHHRGTSIILHLGEEHKNFLQAWELQGLIKRYSDYVAYPIRLEDEQVNAGTALWQRSKDEIEDEEYQGFYKHLSGDFQEAIAWSHFRVEGGMEFTGLIYLPSQPAPDLFWQETRGGLRLHVQKVFIMDDCDVLIPRWLRFIQGVVDSNDLPLNVSRELLQDQQAVRGIKKQVVKKTLDLLAELAKERPEDYQRFWDAFGTVIKEAVHEEPRHRETTAELLRYFSTHGEGCSSLADYVERMADDQEVIYYAAGTDLQTLKDSPHLERLKAEGREILFMVEPIDEWVVRALGEYNEKKLVSAMHGEESDEEVDAGTAKDLLAKMKEILGDAVGDVVSSRRLQDSPVCLVVPQGAMHAHVERMMRNAGQGFMETKQILEVNPDHEVIQALARKEVRGDEDLERWVHLLYDQALLVENSPLPDPNRLAKNVTDLMGSALQE